ncbi:hypothetical protein SUGI_1131230 [Cryptomeria japonica]|nr:hypothetical protein SUGI_1131230 [Cryptomeria japonica]
MLPLQNTKRRRSRGKEEENAEQLVLLREMKDYVINMARNRLKIYKMNVKMAAVCDHGLKLQTMQGGCCVSNGISPLLLSFMKEQHLHIVQN